MALAFSHLKFLLDISKSGIISGPVSMMEFGEQIWFGDVNYDEIIKIAKILGHSGDRLKEIESAYNGYVDQFSKDDQNQKDRAFFGFAELYYKILFNVKKIDAIDLHGTEKSKKHDLNTQVNVEEQYEIVTNFGTGEHVFNQYMFFKNMHDLTKVGGFMMHSMPNQGCYDHGFFNYHPTFLFDLAKANGYDVLAVVLSDLSQKPPVLLNIDRVKYVEMAVQRRLSKYSALFTLFRKTRDAAFVTPQQGFYDNALPDNLRMAWLQLER